MKNWKKVKGVSRFDSKKDDSFILYHPDIDMGTGDKIWIVHIRNKFAEHKFHSFKTKIKALAYAKSYMRKN